MKTVVKIAAVLVMVLSALLFIAMLAGIFGAWWARGQAVDTVTAVAALGDQALARGQGLVTEANEYVAAGQGEVSRITTGIAKAGVKAEETNLLLAAAEAAFDKDLSPGLQRLNERGQDIRQTVAIVDQTLSLLRRLPGQGESKLLDAVDSLIVALQSIDQTITETREAIKQAKSAGLDRLVSTLTAPLDRASTALTAVSERLSLADQRLANGRAEMIALRDQVNAAITWAAVIGTFALLWMALAQLGLFLHAYGVFTGRDPLARWHRRGLKAAAPTPAPVV